MRASVGSLPPYLPATVHAGRTESVDYTVCDCAHGTSSLRTVRRYESSGFIRTEVTASKYRLQCQQCTAYVVMMQCLLHHGVAPFLLSDSVACDCSALVVAATKAAVLLRSTAAPLDIRSDQMRSDHSLQILLHRCRYTSGHIRLFDIADSALRVRNPIPRHMLYWFDRH